jgi:thymidine phosphorylase
MMVGMWLGEELIKQEGVKMFRAVKGVGIFQIVKVIILLLISINLSFAKPKDKDDESEGIVLEKPLSEGIIKGDSLLTFYVKKPELIEEVYLTIKMGDNTFRGQPLLNCRSTN